MKSKPKPNPVEPLEDEQQPDPFSTNEARESPAPTTNNGEPGSEAIAKPLIEQKAIAPPVAAAHPGDGITPPHKREDDSTAEDSAKRLTEQKAIADAIAAARPEVKEAIGSAFPTTADSDPLFENTRSENGCLIYEGTELLDSQTQRCIYRSGEVLRKDKLQTEIMSIYKLYVPPAYISERFDAAMNRTN